MTASDYIDTSPFWDGAREGRLMLQFCAETARWQAFPRPLGVITGRRSIEWRAATGRGVLASWTVDRMAELRVGQVPRVQALVDLEEGPRLVTWLVDANPENLRIGQALRVHWVNLPDGRTWPAFSLASITNKETP
jgi:uncharacterized OB-fold protein